jgi:lipoprotein NlpD
MRRYFYWVVLLMVLASCTSNPPAPVVDANAPIIVELGRGVVTAVPPRTGYYIVQKGDNLYRIALNNGVATRDLVAWNNLPDETKIEPGQELRIKAPDVEVRPVTGSSTITIIGAGGGTNGSGSDEGGVVRMPKGGKVAYSNTALAQARALDPDMAQPTIQTSTTTVAQTPDTSGNNVANSAPGTDWTWPGAGKIMRGFGKNADGEISRGIDVTGRKGEPIQAAADGKVSYVGSLDKYGDFLVIRHEGNYLSVYAHTSKILVKTNQTVTRGQKIAEVGSSGTDQPKLHFEIRYKGEPVDPLKLLPQRQ